MSAVPESLQRYRSDLVGAIDREVAQRSGRRRVGRRYLYAGVAVAAVALLLLVFAEPWQENPTILDRAQAAILAPAGGQVLYESITVRRVPARPAGSVSRVHLWLDGATHRFRMTFSGTRRAEVGGTLGSSAGLNYIASTNALYRAAFQFRVSQSDLDPAAFVRTALRLGRAKIFGRTTVRGTEVIRIQFSAWYRTPAARRLEPIAIYYVDANTYRPVRVVSPPPYGRIAMSPDGQAVRSAAWPSFLKTGVTYPEHAGLGFPMDPSAFLAGFPGTSTRSFPVIPQYTTVSAPRAHLVYDFDNYELLAPTAANRRLTSVRAVRDGIAAYAAGFRAASTPLFSAFNAYYGRDCFGVTGQLRTCGERVAEVRATIPPLLRFVTGHTPPASSLPETKADLDRFVGTLHSLQYGFAKLAALVAADDFVNPTRYADPIRFWNAIFELQADIPELRLRFSF